MKTVKVRDIGVQVNGISYFKNAVFDVTDEDYEPIKEYVDVLKEDRKTNQKKVHERVVLIKVENKELDLKEVERYLYECLINFGKLPIEKIQNPEGKQESSSNDGSDTNVGGNEGKDNTKGTDEEDEELNALKARAQELGINVTHNMKKETIIKKIEEATKDLGEDQNPEGE